MTGTPDDIKISPTPSRWLAVIEAVAISPNDARELVTAMRRNRQRTHPSENASITADKVADAIIKRYAKLAMFFGAVTALPGTIPGVGTMIAVIGGGAVDLTATMKLQVDMCRCLAECYGHDLKTEDVKHLTMLIAFAGTIEQAAGPATVKVGSRAGVKMIQQYLKGSALQTLKQMLRTIGVNFTRKSMEKAIPFGVGAAVGSSINYGLTRYVGRSAKAFFLISSKEFEAAN